MPFQTKMNQELPHGVEGDFATVNPYASYASFGGQLVAGDGGVTVGRFAWVDTATGKVTNAGSAAPSGFVHRDGQASITIWLGEASMLIQEGREVTLHVAGDYYVKTKTAATIGQKVFASTTDGTISTGAAGATIAGSIETKFSVLSAGAVGELIAIGTWK